MSHIIEKYLGKTNFFIDKAFRALNESNINVENYELDHICYRVETDDRYFELKNIMNGFGELLSETQINGRNISTFKLIDPILYDNRKIYCIELPSAKKDSSYKEGFEHIEFVINTSLESFIKQYKKINFYTKSINKQINPDISIKYDGFSVKFHLNRLEYVIKYLQS